MNVSTLADTNRKSMMLRTVAMMLCCMMFCSVFLLGTSSVALCDDLENAAGEIQNAITIMTETIYTTMRKIITPIVIVALGFAGFQFLLGGNQGTEKARKAIIAACIGLALVLFAPLFGKAIATAFMSSGSGDFSSYNPIA